MEICSLNILLPPWFCPRTVSLFYSPVWRSHGDSMTASDGRRESFLIWLWNPPHVERTSSAAFITLTSTYCRMETRPTVAQLWDASELYLPSLYINATLSVLSSQRRRKARSVCFRTHQLPGPYWVSLGRHAGNLIRGSCRSGGSGAALLLKCRDSPDALSFCLSLQGKVCRLELFCKHKMLPKEARGCWLIAPWS